MRHKSCSSAIEHSIEILHSFVHRNGLRLYSVLIQNVHTSLLHVVPISLIHKNTWTDALVKLCIALSDSHW